MEAVNQNNEERLLNEELPIIYEPDIKDGYGRIMLKNKDGKNESMNLQDSLIINCRRKTNLYWNQSQLYLQRYR